MGTLWSILISSLVLAGEADLMAVLKKALAGTTEMSASGVANTDQYRISLVHRVRPAGAIAHPYLEVRFVAPAR